jgi:hypothetical protein
MNSRWATLFNLTLTYDAIRAFQQTTTLRSCKAFSFETMERRLKMMNEVVETYKTVEGHVVDRFYLIHARHTGR